MRILNFVVVAFIFVAAAESTPVGRGTNPCDGSNHGNGTPHLCKDERIAGDGAFLESENEAYRLYITGGNIIVADVSDENNPVQTCALYTGQDAYGLEYRDYLWFGASLVVEDTSDEVQMFWEAAYSGIYTKLENDGTVRFYRADGPAAGALCS